jgi:hypothetical protein
MANLTITAANLRPLSATTQTVLSGAALSIGQAVYVDDADGKAKLSDANVTAAAKVLGLVIAATSATDQKTLVVTGGDVTLGATLVAGTNYYLSATAGAICPEADLTTGDRKIRIGWAKTTATLVLDIEDTAVVL